MPDWPAGCVTLGVLSSRLRVSTTSPDCGPYPVVDMFSGAVFVDARVRSDLPLVRHFGRCRKVSDPRPSATTRPEHAAPTRHNVRPDHLPPRSQEAGVPRVALPSTRPARPDRPAARPSKGPRLQPRRRRLPAPTAASRSQRDGPTPVREPKYSASNSPTTSAPNAPPPLPAPLTPRRRHVHNARPQNTPGIREGRSREWAEGSRVGNRVHTRSSMHGVHGRRP
jgi:hypothetical protein